MTIIFYFESSQPSRSPHALCAYYLFGFFTLKKNYKIWYQPSPGRPTKRKSTTKTMYIGMYIFLTINSL